MRAWLDELSWRLTRWSFESNWLWRLPGDLDEGRICRPFCWVLGHYPEMDQCGKPEHDYCLRCRKIMPGAAH